MGNTFHTQLVDYALVPSTTIVRDLQFIPSVLYCFLRLVVRVSESSIIPLENPINTSSTCIYGVDCTQVVGKFSSEQGVLWKWRWRRRYTEAYWGRPKLRCVSLSIDVFSITKCTVRNVHSTAQCYALRSECFCLYFKYRKSSCKYFQPPNRRERHAVDAFLSALLGVSWDVLLVYPYRFCLLQADTTEAYGSTPAAKKASRKGRTLLPVPMLRCGLVERLGAVTTLCMLDEDTVCKPTADIKEVFLVDSKVRLLIELKVSTPLSG